jgi:AAA15 family ATPase/GTPase
MEDKPMRYFIIKSTINGIKNIDKEVTLSFYPHTVKKKMNISRTNLKAIYGMNGCGKSAIVNAFDMYEKLISNKNYIPQTDRLLFDSLIKQKQSTI